MIWAHKRRSPSCPWLYYCPVAFVTLSLVQYRNMFLGGVSWYLTFLALATTIALLDAVRSPRVAFVAAIAAAVVGSYSSFAGLLIWPAGLALLYLRGRGWRPMAVWVASGGLAAALYFRGFTFDAAAHPSTGYLSGHLWQATQVFLTAVGDVVGVTITSGSAAGGLVQLLGALVLMVAAVAAVAVVVAVRTRATAGGGPVGVAMIIFGVLFAALDRRRSDGVRPVGSLGLALHHLRPAHPGRRVSRTSRLEASHSRRSRADPAPAHRRPPGIRRGTGARRPPGGDRDEDRCAG